MVFDFHAESDGVVALGDSGDRLRQLIDRPRRLMAMNDSYGTQLPKLGFEGATFQEQQLETQLGIFSQPSHQME